MLLVLMMSFMGSLSGGVLGAYLVGRFLIGQGLIRGGDGKILEPANGPRFRRTIQKRSPKVNTDIKAYERELQELGENRG